MGTKWLFFHDHCHTQCGQLHSLQRSSNCQSLAENRNRSSRAGCGVCVASRPTTHNTSHLFLLRLTVQKSHGDVASVPEACDLRRHASLKKVQIASTSTCVAKLWNFSRFSSHVVPFVNDAIGVGITVPPLSAETDTRSPESTHLMSQVSRGSLAYSLITPMTMAWALFQGRFSWIECESGPHMRPFEWERLVSRNLLEVQRNPFTDHGSLFEPQKDHHLGVKVPLITVCQITIEHVQIIQLDACFCRGDKFFGLIQRNAGASNDSPTAPSLPARFERPRKRGPRIFQRFHFPWSRIPSWLHFHGDWFSHRQPPHPCLR